MGDQDPEEVLGNLAFHDTNFPSKVTSGGPRKSSMMINIPKNTGISKEEYSRKNSLQNTPTGTSSKNILKKRTPANSPLRGSALLNWKDADLNSNDKENDKKHNNTLSDSQVTSKNDDENLFKPVVEGD